MVYSVINIPKGTVEKKADMGCIMSIVKDDNWNQVALRLRSGNQIVSKKPNYVFDIYKMRRGQYKNVRIWSYIDLGTGEREDLYLTTMSNDAITSLSIFKTHKEIKIADWYENLEKKTSSFQKGWDV